MIKISPSVLASDFSRLGEEAAKMEKCDADYLHLDVMDGHFVPNLTFGPHILKGMRREAQTVYDVHLMLSDPLPFVDRFADAGADIITVHAEAHAFAESLRQIRARGLRAGASLRPGTGVEALKEQLGLIDRVLLMTVEPGFGGQKLMPEVLGKVRELRALGFRGEVEADGGIKPENMRLLTDAGVEVLVMGTAFFGAENPREVARLVHAI